MIPHTTIIAEYLYATNSGYRDYVVTIHRSLEVVERINKMEYWLRWQSRMEE